ncbi:MAG: transposase [Halomonas sp.]|uniref:transposase n=1 Tax=Halomonas sp. TaxID=1486246 RepID=UPI0019D83BA0|nr:transposase [Halomonas sp.]MBE0490544.1 transposase [Halomonas sp.]
MMPLKRPAEVLERGIMPAAVVCHKIRQLLSDHVSPEVRESTLDRLTLLVTGMIKGKSASPAAIAKAVHTLGLSGAKPESIERRVRRIENDDQVTAALCFHPFAKERLLWGRPSELLLIMDPTTEEDDVVMLSAAIWYRGRALPLAWAVWPANTPLEGDGFWTRVEALLALVAELLPLRVKVTWLADRAFGTPAFTDLLTQRGWHYAVRVQGQTRYRDRRGVERPVKDLVRVPGQRSKLRGRVFKKRGWREASVIVYWGRSFDDPLCLVSDLPPRWYLLRWYRRRYGIEATFRDYKSYGWRWEQGQVRDIAHIERLLVGMALATWIALFAGTQVAAEYLANVPAGGRRTRPWAAKRSLFHLGLEKLHQALQADYPVPLHQELTDWDAPNWSRQLFTRCVRNLVFAPPGS